MTETRSSAVGRLADGTPYYAPPGELAEVGDRVCCHLCGRWFLSVASHLSAHGWRKADYVTAFGLERNNSLSGTATRKKRSAAMTARHTTEPAIQRAAAEAVRRAHSGALAAAATAANRGRAHPPERRAKTLAALAGIDEHARTENIRRHADRRLAAIAAKVAAHHGYTDFATYLQDRLAAGASMAAVSREAGLHKDWISRHRAVIAPAAGALRPHHTDLSLQPFVVRLGFPGVREYLRSRHLAEHRTVNAIAAEAGVSRATVLAALAYHGIPAVPHAAARHGAAHRDKSVARKLGFATIAAYVAARRGAGATWKALVGESGLPETTLRRHSA